MSQTTRRAQELVEGDRIIRGTYAALVLNVVASESVQIIRKPILLVTVKTANGDSTRLTYYPSTPIVIERDP